MRLWHVKPLAFVALLPICAAWDTPPAAPAATATAQQHQRQHQVQRQSQGQAQNTNVKVVNVQPRSGAGGVGTGAVVASPAPSTVFAAPSWSLPSVGASGNDCPTVGISGGGSGPFGGGGIGPSWISPDCNARKLAEQLAAFGYTEQAVVLLRNRFPEVDEAFKQAAAATQSSQRTQKWSATELTGIEGSNSFCATASASERRRYRDICGK